MMAEQSRRRVGGTRDDFAGRRVTLVGLGPRTNVELARFLVRRGAIVTISDRKPATELDLEISLLGDLPVRLALGGHRSEDFLEADTIFVTPGVPRELPALAAAREAGIAISSEIELLFTDCRSPIIGITGSSGKTTTTTLVGQMLLAAGQRAFVGGNIGVPLINRLEDIGADSWVVLELSSFQLETMIVSPEIAAVLNVTPNHLDRHGTLEAYTSAKSNVIAHQFPTDMAVLGLDDPITAGLAPICRGEVRYFSQHRPVTHGAYRRGDGLVLASSAGETAICQSSEVALRGEHNRLNVLAAGAIASAAGATVEAIRSVATSFTGVEHRLEPIRQIAGVTFYNDSIATAPERTIAALHAFSEPIVLIAGGRSKHLPLGELARLAGERCRAVVTVGEMAEEIEQALATTPGAAGLTIRRAADLADSARVAQALARPGDVVVLSPAGTSFDAYRDFEARGYAFKSAVAAL